ncbi:unnamed protein product [Adineta ricciae]|uniref:Uncharacterized protein n=1 Tax=Adineta ricciae TaxID=249248 RepID=A0A816BD66_ADIRI|nr:unnamed protein product [Adineta ricciae]
MLFISAVIFVINGVSALSYNQPKLCPTASWNEVSRTFAHEKANVTRHPIQFIDTKNTIYTASEAERQIFIRHEGQTSSKSIGYLHNSSLSAIFVIDTDDIYTSYENRKIEKWIANKNEYVHIMDTESTCFDLFIDIENNLYCSMSLAHKVVKRQLNEAKTTIVAGVDTAGYESHQLNSPTGIFVDTNLDLYVADRMNNRIQLFHLGETDGKTIVGDDSSDITISLRGPYSIVLDSDKYFYIAEYDNRRIIASGPNGFRRLFKPSLNKCPRCSVVVHAPFGPTKVSFDVHGNLFVSDLDNRRIQIFDLQKDSCVSVPSIIQTTYSSVLTNEHPRFSRNLFHDFTYRYEAIEITVHETDFYILTASSSVDLYGHVYKDDFHRFDPSKNLIAWFGQCCRKDQFKFTLELQANTKYILVVTTYHPKVTGPFSIITYGSHPLNLRLMGEALGCAILPQITLLAELQANTTYILLVTTMKPLETLSISITVSGPADVTFERFIDNSAYCHVGGLCERQVKGIGLTLDDILRLELKRNMTINDQPLVIKISAALTTIMLFVGVISSAFSLLTFQNGNLRTVGCGLYLLASSITSFLTITMFAIKFWFVVITQTNVSIDLSVLQGGCKSIETLLKLFFYWDAWLNACIAVERAVNVYKGVSFDKEKSKRFARWIIFILPNCISATVIHEPLYRHMFSYEDKEERFIDPWYKVPLDVNVISTDTWCTTSYSQSIENYNTVILFIHLLGPFIANFCCALFIIIRSARRRAEVQKQQSYRKHVREQWKEHKHLVISPMILLLLSTPRLIISLLSGCVNVTNHLWLYLCAYFISFLPSVLFFILFVIPSDLYRKTFKESFFRLCRRKRRSNQI